MISEETRKKLSDATKLLWMNEDFRKKMKEARVGKKPWNKGLKTGLKPRLGQHHTEEYKQNLRNKTGEKSSNWKGGITTDKLEYRRQWYKNLPENKKKELRFKKNKRNRLKQATCKELGTHTYGEWELLKKQYNYTCPCCGLSEPFNQKSKYLTEDHIIPLSKGGSDLIENIQPLCLSCNVKKHTLIIKY